MKINFRNILLLTLFLLGAEACQKVDSELEILGNAVSVAADEQVLLGDSLTVEGRIHIEQNPLVTLGGVPVDYVYKGSTERQSPPSSGVNIPVTVETIRFRVTGEMGLGRQPLVVRTGDHSQTLYVNILYRPELGDNPDTTLVVEELYNNASNRTHYGITYGSVTDDGTIYLLGSTGMHRFAEGRLQPFLLVGDELDIAGAQATVTAVAGMVADADDAVLYLSLQAETAGGRAWYLLRTDPELAETTVLNRTDASSPATIRDSGPIDGTRLQAEQLFVDAQGRLLFRNTTGSAYYARVETDGEITRIPVAGNAVVTYSPDGLKALVGTALYDLGRMEPEYDNPSSEQWFLNSFEENPDWAFKFNTRELPSDLNGLIGMPGGIFLHLPVHSGPYISSSNAWLHPSIGALNPATRNIYTYAGIERGYGLATRLELESLQGIQNQLTGQAKYVHFNIQELPNGRVVNGPVRLLGVDRLNNVYFVRGGQRPLDNNPTLAVVPLGIYRLGKPADTEEPPAEE